jgi:hypothetical protein
MIVRLAVLLLFLAACRSHSSDVVMHNGASVNGPRLEIYTYGLANPDLDRAHFRVAQKWGFSHRTIAGCVVTAELLDSANRHNSAVEAALAKRHGADWKTRYERDVVAAMTIDMVMRTLALKNKTIVAAQRSLDHNGKGLLFEPTGNTSGHGFEVVAYTYDTWHGQPAYVTQYILNVDTLAKRADIKNSDRALLRLLD